MPSSTFSSSPYRWFVLNVAATVWVIALATLVRGEISGPRVDTGVSERWFWQQKILARGPHRLVLAGDSRVYRGLAPEVFAEVLALAGGEVLNFGFSNGAFDARYRARLDALVEDGGLLVLAVSPGAFTPASLRRNGFLALEARYGHLRERPVERLKHRLVAPLLWWADGPWFRPLDEQRLEALLAGHMPAVRFHQRFMASGWVASDAEPRVPSLYYAWFERKFIDNMVDEHAIAAFLDDVARWRARGVRVFAVRLPIDAGLRAREDRFSGFDWPAFRRRLADRGGLWLDPGGGPYATFDGSHLTPDSARAFSQALACALAARTRAPAPRSETSVCQPLTSQ